MSATESKVKIAPKTSKKTLKSAEAEALKVALDAAHSAPKRRNGPRCRTGRVCPGVCTGEVSPEC